MSLITKSHQRTGRQRCLSYQAIRALRDVKPKPEMGEGGLGTKTGLDGPGKALKQMSGWGAKFLFACISFPKPGINAMKWMPPNLAL